MHSNIIQKTSQQLKILIIIMLIVNQFMIMQALPAFGSSGGSGKLRISDNANQSEIISGILPQESDMVRPYEWNGQTVTLTAQTPGNGYDMLVAMNQITLTDQKQLDTYNRLSKEVYHPCCDVAVASCGCKHAVAAKGLMKYMVSNNYTESQIKDEVFLWNRFWWPKHYATAALYLNSQGVNPSTISTDEWLGPKMSTVRAGRKMKALLGQ